MRAVGGRAAPEDFGVGSISLIGGWMRSSSASASARAASRGIGAVCRAIGGGGGGREMLIWRTGVAHDEGCGKGIMW